MGKRAKALSSRGGRTDAAFDAVRRVLQSDRDLSVLSPEETSLLAGELTMLLARVERVKALGGAYAEVEASRDVHELLARLEAGSSLSTGVH